MPILGNGCIVPSILNLDTLRDALPSPAFDNYALREGEVQELVYPDDKRSRSKKWIEYRVLVQQRSNGTGNGKMYENCLLINSLSGLADKSFYTLRGAQSGNTSNEKESDGLGKGSKVLVLCVNGETSSAIIIGGKYDQADKFVQTKDLGHHSLSVFNGITSFIDKDGQYSLIYGGKTEIDGTTKVDSKITGTSIILSKDGNVTISDKNGKNAFIVDHKNDRTLMTADGGMVQINDDGILILGKDGAMINVSSKDGSTGISIVDAKGNSVTVNADGIAAIDKSGSGVIMAGDGSIQVAGDSVVVSGGQVDIAAGSITLGSNPLPTERVVTTTDLGILLQAIIQAPVVPMDGGATFKASLIATLSAALWLPKPPDGFFGAPGVTIKR